MDAKSETLYEVLKRNLKPIPSDVFLKGNECAGGLLVATLGVDICERCRFTSADLSTALSELLCSGVVVKKVIGKRSVLVFGEWRFSQGVQRYKEIFLRRVDERLPHEVKNELVELTLRYSPADLKVLEKAFEAFCLLRRNRILLDSQKLQLLTEWHKFPTNAVVEGLGVYLDRKLYVDGYNEHYAIGIIRNIFNDSKAAPVLPQVDAGVEALKRKRQEVEEKRRKNA